MVIYDTTATLFALFLTDCNRAMTFICFKQKIVYINAFLQLELADSSPSRLEKKASIGFRGKQIIYHIKFE